MFYLWLIHLGGAWLNNQRTIEKGGGGDNLTDYCPCTVPLIIIIIIIIIMKILSFDIAPFPYKHAQRRITFHCQRIDVDVHIVN